MKKIGSAILVSIILVLLALALIPVPTLGMTGSGTAGDPYMIYDVDDLQDMQNVVNAYYELANDIDASETSSWNGGDGFEPVGISPNPFTGSFEGNGYTISDLYINRYPDDDYVGLFGEIDGTVSIQNVYFDSAYITGWYHVGTLAGEWGDTQLDRLVFNVHVTDSVVFGRNYVGGLIGTMDSPYSHSHNCSYCSFVGNVTGDQIVGGLIGHIPANVGYYNAWLYRCYTIANVGDGDRIGGLVGHSMGNLVESCSFGYVEGHSGYEGAGGLVGRADGNITDCFSWCDIEGGTPGTYGQYIGGLIGKCDNTLNVDNCYCIGYLSGGKYQGGMTPTGGVSTWAACFWDIETSGIATSSKGTGKNTTDMKTQSTFTSAGWDFDHIWDMNPSEYDGYPYLMWKYPFIWEDYDVYQVLWFQPNDIIEGATLPDRMGTEDGIITWGANPSGITVSHGELIPEEEYDFESVIPDNRDIIKPEPEIMTGDVDLIALRNNPLYPVVQILSIDGFLNERLVWLGMAFLIVILAMLGVHLGFDTHKDTEKPQHFILTTITGLGLSILFYVWGIFPLWVIILMSFGLVGAIIWERQPVI